MDAVRALAHGDNNAAFGHNAEVGQRRVSSGTPLLLSRAEERETDGSGLI